MIEFENVSFSYTGQEHGGLRDINLKISDGEFVLFCGRSGCGKTTITRLVNGLIPQFYQGELHGTHPHVCAQHQAQDLFLQVLLLIFPS